MKRNGYLIITLGCFRNEVESDLIRGTLCALGMEESPAIDSAALIVVNTCGFIAEACDEGIDTILELDEARGGGTERPPILVLGCMAQRYGEELATLMPEIDGLLGADWHDSLAAAVTDLLAGRRVSRAGAPPRMPSISRTVDSSDNSTLFVRVADGCDRGCGFCLIPSIRGRYASRTPESVCDEVGRLAGGREREVILLAQDLTSYGHDLRAGADLPDLIRRLTKLPEVHWLRLLYLQPEGVTNELVEEVAGNEKACHYFDIPFQHASASVLRRMGRPGDAASYLVLLDSIRRWCPDAALRTTVMVGYPGETDKEFEDLLRFVNEARFDWMGAFIFSAEEGTAAWSLPDAVPAEVAVSRYNRVMEAQEKVEESTLSQFDRRGLEVVIDGISELDGYDFVGRSYREAPVVDGVIHLKRRADSKTPAAPGGFTIALITGNEGLDLAGEIS